MSTADVPGQPTLVRAVSRWQVVGLSVNEVIGSGVYLLPASAAALLGPASIWAVLLAGVAVLLLVLCFAEAASLFDRPGGAYVYTKAAFGDFVGFEVGWMTWVARVTVAASLSAGLAQAIGKVWPDAETPGGRALVIAASLLALTWINVRGVRHSARVGVALAIGKVLPLLILIAAGVAAVQWKRVFPIPAPDTKGLGEAALLLLFAYAGFENTAAAAGEFKNPRRDVPFALVTMIAAVTAIYTLIQLVAVGVVPGLAESKAPLADAAAILIGPSGTWLLTIGAILSIFGTNNGTVLNGSRYLYALADAGRLPRVLARVHPRHRTPWVAVVTLTGIALVLALSGTFRELAAVSVIARMATYAGTAAAVPVLRRKIPPSERTMRLPGGPAIPIAALAVCAVFLWAASVRSLVAGGIALVIGAAIHRFGARRVAPR
jgi:basic amino acid/polyamine antiporter, APA family